MSRIGKAPVKVKEGVEVKFDKRNEVTVKGPKGELTQKIHPDISIEQREGEIVLDRPTEQRRHKALHGLSRALIQNMVTGVTEGYEIKLELVGVGFKATSQGKLLNLSIGYSHDIAFDFPEELTVHTETLKGQNPMITITGINKQLVGQVASKIRSLRPPEPYKGKGIKYVNEHIIRKAGKAASK